MSQVRGRALQSVSARSTDLLLMSYVQTSNDAAQRGDVRGNEIAVDNMVSGFAFADFYEAAICWHWSSSAI